MKGRTYGRLFRHAGNLASLLVGVLWLSLAGAVDTSTCGFLKCEAYKASLPPSSSPTYVCRADGTPPSVHLKYYFVAGTEYDSGTDFPFCNCASQPTIPTGGPFNDTGCIAGCRYHMAGPGICWGPPDGGSARVCDGPATPSGANCNPLDPNEPPAPSTPTVCNPTLMGVEFCMTPLVPPPPDIPKICGTRNGVSVGCVAPPGCMSNEYGYICAGNPPPEPTNPAPPGEPYPPPDGNPPPSYYCTGVGACTTISVSTGGGPGSAPPPGCPSGTHGSAGNCQPDQLCGDGSAPVGGSCPAPHTNCPDGSPAVGGTCNAPGGGGTDDHGQCPDGNPAQHGRCYGNCPDGTRPNNGRCPAPTGACPNGATPVGGRCPVGGTCNVVTDPHHCSTDGNGNNCDPVADPAHCGQNNANAGGGATCAAPPFCTGDPVNCQVLQQAYNTRCAVERVGDAFKVTGDVPTGHEGESPGDTDIVHDVSGDMLGQVNGSGFLGGGSCPRAPQFQMMGHTFDFTEYTWWCSALDALGAVIGFVGAFIAMRILSGG